MFRVGDLVRLSAIGRKTYKDSFDNPWHEVGVIEENEGPEYSMPYYVRWQKAGNCYRKEDLELAYPPISLEQMLKECLE